MFVLCSRSKIDESFAPMLGPRKNSFRDDAIGWILEKFQGREERGKGLKDKREFEGETLKKICKHFSMRRGMALWASLWIRYCIERSCRTWKN